MLESGLEGFQDKHVLRQTREALKLLKETLRSVHFSWLESRSKGEVSYLKFQKQYENLFTNRPADKKFVEGGRGTTSHKKINTGKAPGESPITSDLLKLLAKKILKPLTKFLLLSGLIREKFHKIGRTQ